MSRSKAKSDPVRVTFEALRPFHMVCQPNMPRFLPLSGYSRLATDVSARRATDFYELMARRRSVRHFSTDSVDRSILETCIRTAGTAPSGANRQPWHFVIVGDTAVKHRIRVAAEKEEREFYRERAPGDWLEALAPLGTDEKKPFLEDAPFLIVVFAENTGTGPGGEPIKNYYVGESVGIATGLLISALHNAGLATLTHTPSPMKFLNEILGRPRNERPYVLMPVGYPAEDALVPDITRKGLEEIATFV